MSVEIECPSGMRIRIRGLKGKEGKLLSDKTAIRQGTFLDNILAACTEEVVDPGAYTVRSDGKLDWSKVLIGDRFYALLQIRLASFGPEYAFTVQCKDQLCRERFEYQIDLSTDLEVRRMSAEDRTTFSTGGEFTTTLSDNRTVKYRLATGTDEKLAAKSRGADRAIVDMLMLRITSIEGVGESGNSDIVNQKTAKTIRTHLEDLEWRDLVHLINSLDAHDCGVETEIEIQCPFCSGVQEVQLPFERSFFLPTETTVSQRRSM